MSSNSFDALLKNLQKDLGERAFRLSEAPNVKVLSSGITSLDVATGIGGFPRGTLVEVFGPESSGKTALAVYAMAEAHKQGGYSAIVNLESNITKEGWLIWAATIAPPWFDPERVMVINADPGSESLQVWSRIIASGGVDVCVYDSIGAMSTDKELQIGQAKQAYGQSAMVTQLIKQTAKYAYDTQCIPILLNQIRDDTVGTYVVAKAPGGHAKDHFATLRIQLRTSVADFKKTTTGGIIKVDGDDVIAGFRVNATIVKNKVGSPRRKAYWNYWNYKSPEGIIGIDTVGAVIDTALQRGLFEKKGSWYMHDSFPEGKLQGGAAVVNFLRNNDQKVEELRRALVLDAWNTEGSVMQEEEEVEV
jgi:recombination protein RecA